MAKSLNGSSHLAFFNNLMITKPFNTIPATKMKSRASFKSMNDFNKNKGIDWLFRYFGLKIKTVKKSYSNIPEKRLFLTNKWVYKLPVLIMISPLKVLKTISGSLLFINLWFYLNIILSRTIV